MDDINALLNSMAAKTGNVSTINVDSEVRVNPSKKKRKHNSPDGTNRVWNEDVQVDVTVVASSEQDVRPCNLHSVFPAYEIQRQKSVQKLKAKLGLAVEQMGLPKLPNSAYETWQFCSKLTVPDGDPLIPHSSSDYAGLRDELLSVGANRHAANKTCRALTQEAHRVGQSLLRFNHGGGKKHATIKLNEGHYLVSYGGVSLRLNSSHLDKLQSLFDQHKARVGTTSSQFSDSLFCLMLRYESLDGGGFQAALNEDCFDVLLKHFDCKMECFASPFNCRYGRFCSAFLDTDMAFGSFGSFFDFVPSSGCFEANPPFVPNLIAKMADHMTECLKKATKALCFIIIIPAWDHTDGWQVLKNSAYNKEYLLLSQKDHGYCEGKQQMRPTRYRIASFDTSVFFWQNAKAAKEWPVTQLALDELKASFKSKQIEERDELGLKHGGKKVKKVKA